MINPITPQDATRYLPTNPNIPDEIIWAINELILRKFNGVDSFDITWDEIKALSGIKIIPNDLDFKPYYIKSGWDVKWIKESNYVETGYDRWEFKSKQ